MLWVKQYVVIIMSICMLTGAIEAGGQNTSSPALFHFNPFRQLAPQTPRHGRRTKIRLNAGLIFDFFNNDPHYTNSTTGNGAYTLGANIEIPVLKSAAIITGAEFVKESVTFNSYFFAPGYSFLYNGDTHYNHTLDIDELHIPIEYKFCFPDENRNMRCWFFTFGWIYRIIAGNNTLVQNVQNGKFVWEGKNDLTYLYSMFSPYGSGVIEASFGYQRNFLRTGNAFFFEMQYKYGVSPYVYAGNNNGSNYVLFTLNSLSLKIGLRL